MLQLIVANHQPQATPLAVLCTYLRAQIDNSAAFGWSAQDVVVMTNFPFVHGGVEARQQSLNDSCLTGSKVFAVANLLQEVGNEMVWCHDLDAWQNAPFDPPDFKDVGICCYSTSKYNGGSVFYRTRALDIVQLIRDEIVRRGSNKEEPVLNDVLKNQAFSERVSVLNSTYNVGCSGYRSRYPASEKPVRCVHFHPTNRIAWDMHVRNRYGIEGHQPIDDRLRETLIRHFGGTIGRFRYDDGQGPQSRRTCNFKASTGFNAASPKA